MTISGERIRVLYSFPHKLGADRICYTAWQQVNGLAAAGADIAVHCGAVARPVPDGVAVKTTLARRKLRIPYRLLGRMRACALHDYVVSRRVEALAGKIDVIHTWPLGALRTLEVARRLGIATVLERPNAHTRFAYEVVERECERLRVPLPPRHEHAYQPDVLKKEEAEYKLATRLLCPSEFTMRTFLDEGFPPDQLARHIYGYDENIYYPKKMSPRNGSSGLRMLFVGVCAVRKGLHYALEAWLRSPASRDGIFQIAGAFLPAYRQRLTPMLSHPSVRVLGHQHDIAALMRDADVLVLPSIEEGFGLVCTEAMGSGCVPLVSEACTDICEHNVNALVHPIGDVSALESHITMLWKDNSLLERLRACGLQTAPNVTWGAAGRRLLDVYRNLVQPAGSEAQIGRRGSRNAQQLS